MVQKIKSILYYLVVLFIDFLVLVSTKLLLRNEASKNRLLIVKPDAIGDYVIWSGFQRELMSKFSDYEITLVCLDVISPLAVASENFSNVIPLNKKSFQKSFVYRYQKMWRVAKLKPEVAIYPCRSRNFLVGDSIIHVCNAKQAIGFESDGWNDTSWQRRLSNRWYTQKVRVDASVKSELDIQAVFIEAMGIQLSAYPASPIRHLPSFNHKCLPADGKFAVIAPGAGWRARQWPVDRFVSVISYLYREYHIPCVIVGGSSDLSLADAIILQAGKLPVFNYVGETTLQELCGLISAAHLVVSNESSAIHIAAAVETKAVCILGGGHFGRFAPYTGRYSRSIKTCYSKMSCFNCNWQCDKPFGATGAVSCIDDVMTEDVFASIDTLLQPGSPIKEPI